LHDITLTPLLSEEIIATQKNDEGMEHLRRRFVAGDPEVKCCHEDVETKLIVQGSHSCSEERSAQEEDSR
jgi:hypothetical protein